MRYFDKVWTAGTHRFGITHDLVRDGDAPYLERWILWFGWTVRLHCFHKGDDDRAFHDHPWWFITIPLRAYEEQTPDGQRHRVRRFRPHFRTAQHQHIVRLLEPRPAWTLIITGAKSKEWGFWDQQQFVHHEAWLVDREAPK